MQKIISLFKRNYDGDHLVMNEIVPGAEWVINGEGIATRKFDGTCCKIENDVLYKRYDAKKGKTPPEGFIPAQEPDEVTGHWPGWLKIGNGNEDRWFREGYFNLMESGELTDGTFELCGPKINGNKEGFLVHILIPHGKSPINDVPRTFGQLRQWFSDKNIEGIVWHHLDGRMVKIKKKDFGYKR